MFYRIFFQVRELVASGVLPVVGRLCQHCGCWAMVVSTGPFAYFQLVGLH